MTEENKPDVAVDFYYRMRAAITGRKDRDTKRREKTQRQRSKPFDSGRDPKSIANTMDELIQSFGWQSKVAEGELFANWKDLVEYSQLDAKAPLGRHS
jgi:predicted nucleic acid-binding Zn ribbon protein